MPASRVLRSRRGPVSMDDATRERLKSALAVQAAFARGYSTLSAAICEGLQKWIADPASASSRLEVPQGDIDALADRVVALIEGDGSHNELQPVLKLAAILHRFVLDDDPRMDGLRVYYSTVGGESDPGDAGFEGSLYRAMTQAGDELFELAARWTIQTNESSRGLAWLLPAAIVGAEAVHLVELGASAGLNLYAEQRSYDLAHEDGHRLHLGRHAGPQFEVAIRGDHPPVGESALRGPDVLSRFGCDINPLDLTESESQRVLTACIWGDQPARMERLREGLNLHARALRERAGASGSFAALDAAGAADRLGPAVRLHKSILPEETLDFLQAALPTLPQAPVVCFNTYVTAFFNDVEHRALGRQISNFAHNWSLRHQLPWMWVRFETPRSGEPLPPRLGWCRWRVELWLGGEHRILDLGWAHPHMREAEFGPAVRELEELGR